MLLLLFRYSGKIWKNYAKIRKQWEKVGCVEKGSETKVFTSKSYVNLAFLLFFTYDRKNRASQRSPWFAISENPEFLSTSYLCPKRNDSMDLLLWSSTASLNPSM